MHPGVRTPCRVNRNRIIVERLHRFRSVPWDGRPESAFGGGTPVEKVDRLAGFASDREDSAAAIKN